MASMIRPFPNPADGLLLGGVFTGLGGWEVAAGQEWSHTFSAEVDKHARAVFQANFGAAPDVGDIMSASASAAKFAHVYTCSIKRQTVSKFAVSNFVSRLGIYLLFKEELVSSSHSRLGTQN